MIYRGPHEPIGIFLDCLLAMAERNHYATALNHVALLHITYASDAYYLDIFEKAENVKNTP
jgi:hypothetical protein